MDQRAEIPLVFEPLDERDMRARARDEALTLLVAGYQAGGAPVPDIRRKALDDVSVWI